jgi:omega-amidase
MNLIALQIKTSPNFQENLIHLKDLINSCEEDSLILAPELALSGFSYDKNEEASNFSIKAIEDIKALKYK